MILNITSFPRSGNSFFATALLAFKPEWRYAGRPVEFRPTGSLFSFELAPFGIKKHPYVDKATTDPRPVRRIRDQSAVYVYKRHDDPDDYAGPRIYLVRDGRDVLVSYAHHNLVYGKVVRNLEDGKDADHGGAMEYTQEDLHAEMERLAGSMRWGWWVEKGINDPSVLTVVKYRDLKANPVLVAKEALAAVGFEVEEREDRGMPTFEELRALAPWFYRKGQVGCWKDELPDATRAIFESDPKNWEWLRRLGYV